MGAAFAFSLSVLGSLGYDMLVFRRSFPYSLRDILFIRAADVSRITGLVRQGSGFRFFFKGR
jgi:hypothetical protein